MSSGGLKAIAAVSLFEFLDEQCIPEISELGKIAGDARKEDILALINHFHVTDRL